MVLCTQITAILSTQNLHVFWMRCERPFRKTFTCSIPILKLGTPGETFFDFRVRVFVSAAVLREPKD